MAINRLSLRQVQSQDPNQDSLDQQLTGQGKPFYQFQKATEGQQTFTVDKAYQAGSGELVVHYNGQKVTPTSSTADGTGDYTEVDATTIKFIDTLYADDIVEFRMEGKGQGIAYVVDHFHVNREKITGVVDGVNKVFTLNRIPRLGTEHIFVNGRLMNVDATVQEDYEITDKQVTFYEAPASGSKLLASYEVAYKG